MVLKIFKAVWFFSLLGLLGSFLFVYASVPERVVIHEGNGIREISREGLFYGTIAIISVCNVLVFIMSALHRNSADFMAWFYGLIITLNVFFVITLNFLNLYNSAEEFRYQSIGFIIYSSVALFVLWALSWPAILILRKISGKPSV